MSRCYILIVRGLNSQLHFSLLPHLGQLQSQFNSDVLHSEHLAYSAKSSLNSMPQILSALVELNHTKNFLKIC